MNEEDLRELAVARQTSIYNIKHSGAHKRAISEEA